MNCHVDWGVLDMSEGQGVKEVISIRWGGGGERNPGQLGRVIKIRPSHFLKSLPPSVNNGAAVILY